MDYQGNYFPEEQDENESKVYMNVKKGFKWTMYGISFIVYGILFFLLFINRDSNILETNYMTSISQMEGIDKDDIDLYRINTKVFMNELGSLQLYNVDYAPEHKLVEIGVKYNAKKLTNEQYGDCLEYILTDSNGNEYKLVNKVFDDGGRYGFARICFEGIEFDFDSNDLKYPYELEHAATPVLDASDVKFKRTYVNYTLAVYRKDTKELLYEFRLYDNSVTYNKTEYVD